MSTATVTAQNTQSATSPAAARRARWTYDRADFRARATRIACAMALSVCFWFSVPYGIPEDQTQGLALAAHQAAQSFEGSRSRQIAVPLIAAIAIFLLARFPRRGQWKGHLRWPVLAFLLWALVSCIWSQAPLTTAKRLTVFFSDALFAYTLARVATTLELALWGFLTTSAVALLSLFVDIAWIHTFAPFNPDYRFMGVMEANYQAMNLDVGIVCAMTLLLRRPRWARWLVPAVGAELVLLYLTRSRVSTILCILMLAVLAARWARQHWQHGTRVLAIALCLTLVVPAIVLAAGNGAESAQSAFMMGRKDTENTSSLSNRAPLWSELMDYVQTAPILGFGYAGFWTPERVDRISLDQGWAVPHAHETYLDQWLSLGFIGMGLFCIALWGATLIAWQRNRRERTPESLFAALLLTWLCLEGLAESVPLDPYLPTMLVYACLAKMCLASGSEPAVVESAPIVQGLAPQAMELSQEMVSA